jgi:DNA transformation protein
LPNLGKVVEEQLNRVGILTCEELRQIGSREAWLRIQQIDPSACIHRLLALEGAVRGVKKADLSEEEKKSLREFYAQHKIK